MKRAVLTTTGLIALAVLAASTIMLAIGGSSSARAATPTSGVGGTISIGTPALNSGKIDVPINGTAATDDYVGVNITLTWDPTLLSLSTSDINGSTLAALGGFLCLPGTYNGPGGVGALNSCSVFVGSTHAAGLLMTFHLNVVASGCSKLHIVTYDAPDNGDTTFGAYTIDLVGGGPQANPLGPDVNVDTATGATGCATSQPTDTPTATNTPVTPTNTPTATNTPVTPTDTPTATNTPVTPTDTPTATNTPVTPTDTPTATNTPGSATDTPTATNTPVTPTDTPTATNTPGSATDTPTATNTPVTPTDTPTATNTPGSATDTPTATNTPVTPTDTPTPAQTAQAVGGTETAVATRTAQVTKTAQVTQTAEVTKTVQVTQTAQVTKTAQVTRTTVPTATNTAPVVVHTATPPPASTQPVSTATSHLVTSTAIPPTSTPQSNVLGTNQGPKPIGGSQGTALLPNTGQGHESGAQNYLVAILLLALTGAGMIGAVVYRRQHP